MRWIAFAAALITVGCTSVQRISDADRRGVTEVTVK